MPRRFRRANASTGFRAPTPVEFADVFVGNEMLDSESSRSFDIGVRQRLVDDALVADLDALFGRQVTGLSL